MVKMTEEELKKVEEKTEIREDDKESEDESLPFARAQIYRLLKQGMGTDKIIRGSVKTEMNLFLGRIAARVAKRLGNTRYSTVERADLEKIIEPYDNVERLNRERERIIVHLETIKSDCDALISDIRQTFSYDEDLNPKRTLTKEAQEKFEREQDERKASF